MLCSLTTRDLASALLRGGRSLARRMTTRLPLPLHNDRPVETTNPSTELATGRNEGNEDKAVRRREREATRRNRTRRDRTRRNRTRRDRTRRNRTRRNGQRTTPSSTLKIVCGNEVVDLDDLVASAPLCGVRSYPNHHHQRPILTLLV